MRRITPPEGLRVRFWGIQTLSHPARCRSWLGHPWRAQPFLGFRSCVVQR